MKHYHIQDNTFFFRLVKRFTIFLTLQIIVILSLYIRGSYQNFLDSTQRFLLLFCSINAVMLVIFSIAGLVQSIILLCLNKEKKYILYFLGYLVLIIVISLVFTLLRSITILSLGLHLQGQ